MPPERRKPFWLLPNLLSLDAPLVAVAWLYIFAKTWRVVYLPSTTYLSLGLVVWVIYVTDRLLDALMNGGNSGKLEARHEFHRKHQKGFRVLAMIAGLVALILVVTELATKIYGYALFGGLMVAAFFTLSIFSTQGPNEIPYAKNILAGFSFAYGTAMLAWAYTGFDSEDLLKSPELICFVVLCILNIAAIDLWEHANRSADPEIKATDELALTLPLTLLGAAALIFAVKDPDLTTRPFFYAILTGAALLQILNRNRGRFSMDALRVLADAALLVPLLVFLAASQA
ncbi:MAG: hypothetical protein RLZZ214_3877 [Verrucomicrobiota bacterium]